MDHAVLETSSDRYVIREYLAEGGMGAIYLGKKLGPGGFEKAVVLKQLLPEFTSEQQFIDLFLREARITASLDHANIVHTIDLVSAGSDYFIVMEYVRGGDLRTLMRRARRRGKDLSPQAALFVGGDIADALGYAHAKLRPDGQSLGLIHRDVSPSNILLSGSGEVKLTDFGIAKASTHRSVFYRVKGKVGYMSPEQARGDTLDGRSDLYSLAVCIYEALTAERLFVADMLSTASMIYSQPIPRLSDVRPGLPRDLDVVMQKALALTPEARFQTAEELHEALRKAALRHGLLYSSSEMAAHLVEVCGRDVDAWLRSEVGDERGGGTELYAQEAPAPARGAPEPPAEDDEDEPDEDSEEGDAPRRIGEGTQLTSILNLAARKRAQEEEERVSFEAEPTYHYEGRRAVTPAPAPASPARRPEPRPGAWPDSALDEPQPLIADPPIAKPARPPRREKPRPASATDEATRAYTAPRPHPREDDATIPHRAPSTPPPDSAPRLAIPKIRPPSVWQQIPPRLLAGLVIALILAVGVAIGVALSDPGAEHDPPPEERR
ncbi:MAG: serine/threonine protein kinase [Myxococcales bacterium]|nr:serine/threonine protein kinase [Myxococcales bacterium]